MKISVQNLITYIQLVLSSIKEMKVSQSKKDYGFGLWSEREDIKDVAQYVREIKKGRYLKDLDYDPN